MDTDRKKQMRLYRKRIRRRGWFMLFLGCILTSIAFLSYFLFVYFPDMEKRTNTLLTEKDQKITSLTNQNNELNAQLDHNIALLNEAEDKKKPRMTFGGADVETKFPELTASLDKQLTAANYIGTVLAVKDNQIILEKGYGYADKSTEQLNDKNTEYLIASVQKAYTAVLVMKLIEEGQLSLETPLSTYYPNVPNSNGITIRSLLNMTSGLHLKGYNPQGLSEEDTITYALKNLTYQPISKWRNAPVNITLLTGIIRQITGQSYETYFTSEIIDKLNLSHTGFYSTFYTSSNHALSSSNKDLPYYLPNFISDNKFASESGTGNIYSSVGDMFTFIQALIDEKIISKESLTELWSRPELPFPYTYGAGFYHYSDYIYAHGNFVGYEPTVYFSKDGSTGLITLSNYIYPDKKNKTLPESLFNSISK